MVLTITNVYLERSRRDARHIDIVVGVGLALAGETDIVGSIDPCDLSLLLLDPPCSRLVHIIETLPCPDLQNTP